MNTNAMFKIGYGLYVITSNDGKLYKQSVSADESIMLVSVGDALDVSYYDTDIDSIKQIEKWSFKVSE